MSDTLTQAAFILAAAMAVGMWFVAYIARKTVETLQTATRCLEVMYDILSLRSDEEAEEAIRAMEEKP